MKTYKPGVLRDRITCDHCGANYWCAARVSAGVRWECAACGDADDRHPVVPENDRLEEDL
jgi:ribosomal protein L37AE/L43A